MGMHGDCGCERAGNYGCGQNDYWKYGCWVLLIVVFVVIIVCCMCCAGCRHHYRKGGY